MGTSNFTSMDQFDIYAYIYEPDLDFIKSEYPEFIDDENNIDSDLYNELAYWEWEYIRDELKPTMDELNDNLIFHKISFESGYYEGMQIYINEPYAIKYRRKNDDLAECLNETWYDKYGDDSHNKNRIIKTYIDEVALIQNWLATDAVDYGFKCYHVYARFDNGETIYLV